MSQNAGNNVADIYKGVLNDVVTQVRESFLDENIDVDILAQLKKEWEDKVIASGCVDMDTRHHLHTHHVAPPAIRQGHPLPQRVQFPAGSIARMQPAGQQVIQKPAAQHHAGHVESQAQPAQQPRPIQMQYVQQPATSQLQTGAVNAVFPQGGTVRMVPMQAQTGQFMNMIQNQQGMMFIQNSNGQHIPVTMGPNGMLQQRIGVVQQQPQQPGAGHSATSHQQLHQLDGFTGREEEEDVEQAPISTVSDNPEMCSSSASDPRKNKKPTRKEAEKVARQLLRALQLDGGGGGMSDSSSEDEEEENDPLRRIADRIGDGQIEDAENIAEEDPLNSEDDQSDDEDLETLFDAENVIMCQFEKVHRARSKWKFILKDGIMHIKNRDYCFQKCTGEAEW